MSAMDASAGLWCACASPNTATRQRNMWGDRHFCLHRTFRGDFPLSGQVRRPNAYRQKALLSMFFFYSTASLFLKLCMSTYSLMCDQLNCAIVLNSSVFPVFLSEVSTTSTTPSCRSSKPKVAFVCNLLFGFVLI